MSERERLYLASIDLGENSTPATMTKAHLDDG